MAEWSRIPKLRRMHPQFFISYSATLFLFSGAFWFGVFRPSHFPSGVIGGDPRLWGATAGVIAAALYIGLHIEPFDFVSRKAMVAGLGWTLVRLLLVINAALDGEDVGFGIPIYGFVAGVLLAQSLEASVNPATAKLD